MVKITNFVNTFEVTQGAYDDIFKKQGFELVEEAPRKKKKATKKHVKEAVEEVEEDEWEEAEEATEKDYKSEEEKYVEKLMEKPISQWNKEEVKAYASIKGLDISKTQNIGEARNIIKQSIDRNN
nr:MAG: Thymopoietin protein [Bacteriophage sp.]